ncbi:MAG: hypothetical protein R3E83_19840 [Burkholderiaceae bacterium]
MDDTHTMFVSLRWKAPRPPAAALRSPLKTGEPLGGARPDSVYLPNTTDWYGRWRLAANASNDWMIDREAQRSNRIFCGIDNIFLQDQAVTESMGGITDHSFERLGPGDLMIARTRRRLLQAARAFRDGKGPAPGVDDPEVFMQSRSGYFLADPAIDWLDAFNAQVSQATRPLAAPSSAELET